MVMSRPRQEDVHRRLEDGGHLARVRHQVGLALRDRHHGGQQEPGHPHVHDVEHAHHPDTCRVGVEAHLLGRLAERRAGREVVPRLAPATRQAHLPAMAQLVRPLREHDAGVPRRHRGTAAPARPHPGSTTPGPRPPRLAGRVRPAAGRCAARWPGSGEAAASAGGRVAGWPRSVASRRHARTKVSTRCPPRWRGSSRRRTAARASA